MFERLVERATALAEARARTRQAQLRDAIQAEAPPGMGVDAQDEAIVLSGRGLRRRLALEPGLRWVLESLR